MCVCVCVWENRKEKCFLCGLKEAMERNEEKCQSWILKIKNSQWELHWTVELNHKGSGGSLLLESCCKKTPLFCLSFPVSESWPFRDPSPFLLFIMRKLEKGQNYMSNFSWWFHLRWNISVLKRELARTSLSGAQAFSLRRRCPL